MDGGGGEAPYGCCCFCCVWCVRIPSMGERERERRCGFNHPVEEEEFEGENNTVETPHRTCSRCACCAACCAACWAAVGGGPTKEAACEPRMGTRSFFRCSR